ncbi:uncharacterized protein LOC119999117 [Tripterygium wilfordii]|uniref:uncharacterized protein LOC119999117 n=1 Tax=Tripterygium wilfordii TaxID=458696 RepID=UPI0018F7FB2D|nr:uncharacterized protein LOC119999117 [Tripterygium wilfordii]
MKKFLLVIFVVAASILLLMSSISDSARDGFTLPKHAIEKSSGWDAFRSITVDSEPMMKEDNNIVVDHKVEDEDDKEDGAKYRRNMGGISTDSEVHGSDSGHAGHGNGGR